MPMQTRTINSGVLEVAFQEDGPADGWPCIMGHGFPYDVTLMPRSHRSWPRQAHGSSFPISGVMARPGFYPPKRHGPASRRRSAPTFWP